MSRSYFWFEHLFLSVYLEILCATCLFLACSFFPGSNWNKKLITFPFPLNPYLLSLLYPLCYKGKKAKKQS